MNPFLAANAVANPGQYAQTPIYGEENTLVESPLSAGGVAPNSLNNLGGLASLFGGSNMSSSQDFSSGLGSVDFSNPYLGESGPVASRQVVDYSSQPVLNPINNTYKAPSPTAGVFGGQEYDGLGNYVGGGNGFSIGSGTMGMFDSVGTNISNFLSDTFGGSYNSNFGTTQTDGLGSVNWGTKNRAFDFGDSKLFNDGKGLQTPSWTADALGFARAAGYDTSGINQGLGLANMTGNRAFDMAASLSGNKYASLLNDDFSQRGMMSKAMSFGNVPYAGGIMGLMDYGQGYNNYSALGSTIGGALLGPMGAYAGGMLGRSATGFDAEGNFTNYINDNYSGAGRDYAESHGFKVGTPEFDYAIKGFESLQRGNKNTVGQQRLVDDWNNQYTTRIAAEQAAAATEAKAAIRDYGQEGDATSRQNGQTFHSDAYNWGSTESHDNTLSVGGYTWDGSQGSVAETQEETGLGTSEWDTSHQDFSWGDSSDAGDGTTDASDDPGGNDDDAGGWSFSDDDSGGGDSGGGGGGGCFTADTLVKDSTGKDKAISEYKIGDSVMSIDGKTANKVKYIEVMSWDDDYELYSPTTKLKPFITKNHPIKVEGKWVSADLDYTERNHPWIDAVDIDTPVIKKGKGIVVYNLWVDGDNTYTVNGYDTETLIGDGGIVRQGLEYGNINMEDFKNIIKSSLSSTPEVTYGMHILNMFMTFITNKKANKFMLDVILGKRDFMPISLFIYLVGKTAMLLKNKDTQMELTNKLIPQRR